MSLQIIGAGFGRTGTESLKTALEILGFGPCHHMLEVLPRPQQTAFWLDVAKGNSHPDWDKGYAGFHAAVDWPTAHYWRELSEYYPDAKVILSYRDPELWYESFKNTLIAAINAHATADSLGAILIRDQAFGGNLDDKQHVIDTYRQHVETVQKTIAPERLLTYHTGSGWPSLCEFLQKPVPVEAYPSRNQTEGFMDRVRAVKNRAEPN